MERSFGGKQIPFFKACYSRLREKEMIRILCTFNRRFGVYNLRTKHQDVRHIV